MTAKTAPIVIVGAGVSGLICAATLTAAGRPVLVLEASDGPGGRIRTDRHEDGFLLDRGFQIILEAYPGVNRQIDMAALKAGQFDSGALIWTGRRLVPVGHPLRHPTSVPRNVTARIFPVSDKLRFARLALRDHNQPWQSANEAARSAARDESAATALWGEGFSDRFVNRFARPFWGGITLDPMLGGSAGPLHFTLKMFLEGAALLPSLGVQAVPDQLVARIPAESIRCDTSVTSLVVRDGQVTGVRVGRKTIGTSAVVVAADPPTAAKLTGIDAIPQRGVGCITIYLRGRRDPEIGKRLVLDGTRGMLVNHFAPLSTVQPSYAPKGEHLVAAVVLTERYGNTMSDQELGSTARSEAAKVFGHEESDWTVLSIVRVPFSQFAQPPGIFETLPRARTRTKGLFLAGEATVDSSLNGAIISGEAAAHAVIAHLAKAAAVIEE